MFRTLGYSATIVNVRSLDLECNFSCDFFVAKLVERFKDRNGSLLRRHSESLNDGEIDESQQSILPVSEEVAKSD